VWQTLVRHLHADRPSRAPPAPAGVVATRVAFEAQREPAREEVFLAGTQTTLQRDSAAVRSAAPRGIASPRDGSIFALDPDIPPAAQRIAFEGEAGVWVLDGKRLGASPHLRWAPWPGRHRLRLLGRDGSELGSVRFEVRGAGVKAASAGRSRAGGS
jgi:penicillin-binding protein 1C